MTISASAAVPPHSRLDLADTAEPIPAASCPRWCLDHLEVTPLLPGDRPVHWHRSDPYTIDTTATDPTGVIERDTVTVHAERIDPAGLGDGDTSIRLNGGECSMTPGEAVQLAVALLQAAGCATESIDHADGYLRGVRDGQAALGEVRAGAYLSAVADVLALIERTRSGVR